MTGGARIAARITSVLIGALSIACSSRPWLFADEEPTAAPIPPVPPAWLACNGKFQCAVVYDEYFCTERAVNTRYAIDYATWSRDLLAQTGDSRSCVPDPESEPRAICRNGRCEIAATNLEALLEYIR